jgi:hypothetical protein
LISLWEEITINQIEETLALGMGILFLQHIKRDTEETVYDSRPRGRGGRGRKGRRRLGITNSTLCLTFIDYGNNSKTENRVQKGVQRSSAAEFQQDLQISASNRINNVPQNTRFNADEVERNLQQRYEEALNSALQNASGGVREGYRLRF